MNRRRFIASIGVSAALGAVSQVRAVERPDESDAQARKALPPNPIWARPVIVPIPDTTAGAEQPVVSLNGTWKFTLNPPAKFWLNEANPSGWDDITVPGECTMQGFAITRDSEYPFKRAVLIPRDFRGKRSFLRFDGLYSYGRVWVNGHYIRDHNGGFTSWDCDITPYVTPEEEAWITVGVTDESDSISWQSNYAKHYIGGMLRDVKLFAVPTDHITRFHVETDFDSFFTNAGLHVTLTMSIEGSSHANVKLSMKDPDGKSVVIQPSLIRLSSRKPAGIMSIPVAGPQKWDSEHPRLYSLEATVEKNGSTTETLVKRFGFRKVEVRGNQMFVNGDPVKLHGGCRHDVYPTLGRMSTPALDKQDVLLLKSANFNFIRTSHYPPSQEFLESCDQHGLYVEEESAVCFVDESFGSHVAAQNDPRYTAQFMNQFAEMMERDRDHSCVVIWSLGNESQWGSNFAKEYAYAKNEDTTRPIIFSFPKSVPEGVKAYDIFSMHYPKFNSDYASASIPRLNDEFGHIPCYNQVTQRRDPGVRNYWGNSIKEFWRGMFGASGCLGGSIWASIDEVFMLPSSCVGYGEWGVIDGWRRKKPEYWLAKKAYSPTKIPDTYVENPGVGKPLKLPIRNEFNHTNLNEIKIEWGVGSERGEIRNLSLRPYSTGVLVIPARAWENGERIHIKFSDTESRLLDEYELPVGRTTWRFPAVRGPAPQMLEDNQHIRVVGEHSEITLSKASGLIQRASYKGHTILEGGPVLNLAPSRLKAWWLTSLKTAITENEAVVEISGNYQLEGNFSGQVLIYAQYQLRIDGGGLITTNFTIQHLPNELNEVGVAYVLPHEVDRLSWNRKALWSVYPSDHIGRAAGVANRVRSTGIDDYRVAPSWPWSQDMKDFFLFGKDDAGGRGTNDFRSKKENIWFASAITSRTGVRARAESDATHAVRAEVQSDDRVWLNINSAWAYPKLDWGNECPALPALSQYEGSIRLRLTDNDSIETSFSDP